MVPKHFGTGPLYFLAMMRELIYLCRSSNIYHVIHLLQAIYIWDVNRTMFFQIGIFSKQWVRIMSFFYCAADLLRVWLHGRWVDFISASASSVFLYHIMHLSENSTMHLRENENKSITVSLLWKIVVSSNTLGEGLKDTQSLQLMLWELFP
jgi:hypothetical protein